MKRAQSSVLATAEATDFPLNAAPDEIISEILFHLPPAQAPLSIIYLQIYNAYFIEVAESSAETLRDGILVDGLRRLTPFVDCRIGTSFAEMEEIDSRTRILATQVC